MSKIKEKSADTDSFHVIWLQLIKMIQSTSIDRFEDLDSAIRAHHALQYARQNLELLASDFCKDTHKLTTAGQHDHNLTLAMLRHFSLLADLVTKTSASSFAPQSRSLIKPCLTSDIRRSQRRKHTLIYALLFSKITVLMVYSVIL